MDDKPRKDRTWLYVGLAFAGFWACILAFINPLGVPEGGPVLATPSPDLTKSTDTGWVLQDLDGKPVSFDSFRGRPIVLNFWATWCGPCRNEMPTLVRLAADPRLKGVVFLGVTGETASDLVKAYAKSNMQGLTVLHADNVPAKFATPAIPATFLIGADGKIAASETGAARWDDPSVVTFLEKLLKQAGPARP
jgi:thiol-disulfide isomerase/thioredoxin